VTCDLGTLLGSDEPEVAIVVRPTRVNDKLLNVASVTSDAVDHGLGDNSAQVTTSVIPNEAGCTILGTSGPDDIRGTSGADVICGFGGDDTLRGGPGDDTAFGNGGDDTLVGGRGSDTLDGGKGNDTVSYRGDPTGVRVDLAGDTATDGFGDTDTLTSVGGGGVRGSDFVDVLRGSDRFNRLYGGPGDDLLSGLGGNDVLRGEAGRDTLRGGEGTDTCSGELQVGCER
jgi:Ca2+-binding RTX toxin-like protein